MKIAAQKCTSFEVFEERYRTRRHNMKTNGKHEVMARIARQSLVLAALIAMVISTTSISRAQSSAASPASPAAKTTAASAKAPAAPAAKPAAKGQHEGITVHGHWVIEVKNPDGKVTARSEFENSLAPPGLQTNLAGPNLTLPGGASLLSALITGQVAMPVAWGILTWGPGASTTGGACSNTCALLQNTQNDYLTQGGEPCGEASTENIGVSCNLSVNPLGTTPNFTGFQMSASVVATQAGTIGAVGTFDTGACGANNTLAGCPFTNTAGLASLTFQMLDGNTVPGDPMPVTVSAAGQTIQVTVNISFH
jgi:hypothetical protein